MTIRKLPTKEKKIEAALEAFVAAAPDSAAAPPTPLVDGQSKPAKRGRPVSTETQVQITVKFSSDDLDRLDEAARERRITRAAFIRQAVFAAI
ncbi:CopG family transcriptional regulator [Propionivibrio sp.]|uniref:ribbon-helix-helix domain-containing protein n=1 Tax=Propionivibrio sp. TaxID=2212460 RepID=UPI003BF31F0D